MKTNHLLWLALSYGAAVLQACGGGAGGHDHHGRPVRKWTQEEINELEHKWGTDWSFSGISTFAHLKHVKCLTTPNEQFDIAIIGAPFDTAVSYRPGARFGPRAIRAASARQLPYRGFNARANINPFLNWAKIIDCGDIPVSPMDNEVALKQMTIAFEELGTRNVMSTSVLDKPKLITLGGDHSLAFPALRALNKIHGGPVRVLHFDAHLDTWHPAKYPNAWASEQASFNHGSVFWLAGQEGLIVANGTKGGKPSVHAGLRTRLSGTDFGDYDDDDAQGWVRISADDMDDKGTAGVIAGIMDTLGTEDPVYLSLDIDVLDPAFAPGTGTPEPGGWTTRELIRVLRGIEGLNLVGADIVEVAPAYQNAGEETALAAAQVVYELLSSMVKRGIADHHKARVVPEEDKEGADVKDEL
ncbi:arginase [Microdochium bolleyi]|uniref:Arginase n=1 Tax=Microdochium bolleyi TaxID=196109 RepID=A0A136JAU1_9PEZI|nr:arginase [Microdochium bolleyi]